jgi:hypothetical protein
MALWPAPGSEDTELGVLMELEVCCARAASGHAAALPSSVRNRRRLGSSMGSSPEPSVPAYRRLRMPRNRPQVIGADLKCSEIAALGGGPWRRLPSAHR